MTEDDGNPMLVSWKYIGALMNDKQREYIRKMQQEEEKNKNKNEKESELTNDEK